MLTDKTIPYCNPEIWGGIECTINRVDNVYFDQLKYIDFYRNPQLKYITNIGFKKVRFPILWEKHQPHLHSTIDWKWTEQQLSVLRESKIEIIAGLVHHGSGPSFTNLLDKNFPNLLAEYAKEVATRFPWIEYYTPVNEPLTTARFSGLYGIWYPHAQDDRSFILMLLNELKGVVLSMQEIRKINPAAKLVQTEDLGKIYSTPFLQYQANFENERRWLSYDLLCGKVTERHPLWYYLRSLDIPEETFTFFLENKCTPDIFGFNHYITSERFLDERIYLYPPHTYGFNQLHTYADVEAARVEIDEETGIESLISEAWERYHKPIAITEVHLHCHREEQLRWFKYVWEACCRLKKKGVDVRGVTSWSLFGSHGWNKLLTAPEGEYESGMFDLRGRDIRSTALKKYVEQIGKEGDGHHPLSDGKGWWQRDTRFLQEPIIPKMEKGNTTFKAQHSILIIGKNGTLGRAFAKICTDRSIRYHLLSRQNCDITDLKSIESAVNFYKPWAIINAAGYVRVDDAERKQEQCFRENSTGAHNLSIICNQHQIKLVTFSTDLVFDGKKEVPYVESDEVAPLNVYGHSKAQSEQLVLTTDNSALVIRTSAFFGPWDKYNFLEGVAQTLSNRLPFYAANDVYISPTYVPDLVHTTLDLLIDDEKGIWHLTNKGTIAWADLAYEVADRFNFDNTFIKAVPISDLNLAAQRPRYSVLESEKATLLPTLDNALQRYFNERNIEIFNES